MASELNSQDGWFCEKHPKKEAELFCETHEVAICQLCANIKTHKPCDLQDIQDVIGERKRCLLDKVAKAKLKSKECNDSYSTEVRQSRQEIEEKFGELNRKIKDKIDKDMEKVNEEKKGRAFKINNDAKVEIAKMTESINKQRDEDLRRNYEDCDRNIEKIEVKRDGLNQNFENYKLKFEQNSESDKIQCQELNEALTKADKLVNEEKHLLTDDFKQVVQLLDEGLGTETNVESVGNISSIEEDFFSINKERLYVPIYKWETEHEFLTEIDPSSHVIGFVKNYGMIIRNDHDGMIYAKNIQNKTNRAVVMDSTPYDIWTSATFDDGKILCGTGNAELVIYDCDKSWQRIKRSISPSHRK